MSFPSVDPPVDRIVRLAASVLDAPVALFTIVHHDVQRFASAVGLPASLGAETPLAYSFCRHVVAGGVPLVVPDAAAHPTLHDSPAVTILGLGAYLGVPVLRADGAVQGSLCVVDRVPRAWTDRQVDVLVELAASVATELALRDELAARRESESRFRALTEHSSDLVCILDPAGRLEYVSPSIERALGFPADAMLGRDAFAFLEHDDVEPMRALLANLLREPGKWAPLTYPCHHAEGGSRVLEGTARNLIDVPGVGGVVVNVADVTGRRLLEAQLRRAQKLEAIGLLAGGIAHDFNNLLTVIQGNLEFLRDPIAGDGQAAADLAEAEKATARATALVRQLLAFGRRQVRSPAVIDVNAIVVDAREMLRRALGGRATLDLDLARGLWPVRADRGQLEQVLMNLALNGRDAMRGVDGDGVLTIETENLSLSAARAARMGLPAAGDYVRLTVRDDGIGMSDATLARLFEPFFTTKPLGSGTGLGLAVVYGIVSQSDGAVHVESTPGLGSRFHVFLPRVDAAVEGRVYATPTLVRGSGTILLVEDEAPVRRATRRTLERAGYRVVEAQHANDALLVWAEHGPASFDALVTDGRMPGLGGAALVARLRAERADQPALRGSGYTSGALEATDGGELPPDVRFLEKPYEAPELLDAVHALLARGTPSRTARPISSA
jgi:PAS domain S-box-containing protein